MAAGCRRVVAEKMVGCMTGGCCQQSGTAEVLRSLRHSADQQAAEQAVCLPVMSPTMVRAATCQYQAANSYHCSRILSSRILSLQSSGGSTESERQMALDSYYATLTHPCRPH